MSKLRPCAVASGVKIASLMVRFGALACTIRKISFNTKVSKIS